LIPSKLAAMPRANSDQSKPRARATYARSIIWLACSGVRASVRHQREHFGVISARAFVDAGCDVAGADRRDIDAGRRHDLVDAVDRLDMLETPQNGELVRTR
jgi:hypothetical protein